MNGLLGTSRVGRQGRETAVRNLKNVRSCHRTPAKAFGGLWRSLDTGDQANSIGPLPPNWPQLSSIVPQKHWRSGAISAPVSLKWPHLSKAARQATWAVLTVLAAIVQSSPTTRIGVLGPACHAWRGALGHGAAKKGTARHRPTRLLNVRSCPRTPAKCFGGLGRWSPRMTAVVEYRLPSHLGGLGRRTRGLPSPPQDLLKMDCLHCMGYTPIFCKAKAI
jgi:hypothetical protein